MIGKHVDDAGWAVYATVFGMLATAHWFQQFATSIVTLAVSLVIAHFIKRALYKRWPIDKRENDDRE